MYTNINLKDENNQYLYVIGINDNNHLSGVDNLRYSTINNSIYFNDEYSEILRNGNVWEMNNNITINEYIPNNYSTSIVTLYFPQFSIETYKPKTKYALTLNTWVHGKEIVLGTYILNRSDALATPKLLNIYGNKYYEEIKVEVVNPWELMYSDNWKDFRKYICGEYQFDDNYSLNSVGSILNISLYPVEEISQNKYIQLNTCHGGQNSLKLSDYNDDILNVKLYSNTTNELIHNSEPAFICNVGFNNIYNQSLHDYIKETYGIENFRIEFELVIGNEDELYGIYNSGIVDGCNEWLFKKSEISKTFKNGIGWKEGISVSSSVSIINEDNESLLNIISNKIPLTSDLFRYFVGDEENDGFFMSDGYKINNIKLNDVDMYLYNVNAINKIENKIIQLDRPENSKSNIITPVFFSNQESSDIIIHPLVVENICINLDAYKSKVTNFILQIEGCGFIEIGRVASGVLFKVNGKMLPNKQTSGNYYIMDENNEMVTTGKYKYVL